MAYIPNTWQDRIVVGGNKFTDQSGKKYTFTPTPDSVSQQGTPFSADWMNHIEQGILSATVSVATAETTGLIPSYTVISLPGGKAIAYGNSVITIAAESWGGNGPYTAGFGALSLPPVFSSTSKPTIMVYQYSTWAQLALVNVSVGDLIFPVDRWKFQGALLITNAKPGTAYSFSISVVAIGDV